ncbi:class I SAM-dependent rRNA methyltransferase [Desulfuromonas carbonis]|uniref:class I SAM-dependent rRNA methyltransferase n=1 Tax=Desulfuromonas sp. DDH964 TaxID=1823759 RepID=UPI00078D0965|nr:class I SAM-dependent rRNA methyltransferase [Desulfuromonas sp. DDH964]AMV72751.1 SAM-dependent methyltransferase, PUA domain-containing [Desulfuromonas sp. DDH964]
MKHQLLLRPGQDRRLRAGHPWVFSNEIEHLPSDLPPGAAVEIRSSRQAYLGNGYFNPHSLIAVRVLSRSGEDIDHPDFYRRRLEQAAAHRHRLYGHRDGVRLVHGEADGLPGLVVDAYGEVLAVQFLTWGIDCRRDLVLQALQELFQPRAIVARNDVAVRELEGLKPQVELLTGDLPDPLCFREGELSFRVDLLGGQKTGAFLDQKENHQALRGRVAGGRVLDLFCYGGGWSLHAAHFGAASVTGIDISPGAVALAAENARRNGLDQVCRFEQGDVFERLRQQGPGYDAVILDPPAFVKSRKKLPEALRGYLTINRRAMEQVVPGGILVTCTCSHHLDRETFLGLLRQAAHQAGREARLLEVRGQAFDHPVLLACPETEYLKCVILQLL